MYPIEHGIPIPDWPPGHKAIRKLRGRSTKYPFSQMTVGDSFLVPVLPEETMRQIKRRILPRVYRENQSGGSKYISRKVKDGIRIWRIK
jgi:hypothetical protein